MKTIRWFAAVVLAAASLAGGLAAAHAQNTLAGACAQIERGELAAAQKWTDELLAKSPTDPIGQTSVCMIQLKKARRQRFPAGFVPLGQNPVTFQRALLDKAEVAFRAALKVEPAQAVALGGLGTVLVESGRFADVPALVSKLPKAALNGDTASSVEKIVLLLVDRRDPKTAEQVAKLFHARMEQDRHARQALVWALMHSGKLDEARALAVKFQLSDSGNPIWTQRLVEIELLSGRPDDALQAAQGRATDSRVELLEAMIRAARGDPRGASLVAAARTRVSQTSPAEDAVAALLTGSLGVGDPTGLQSADPAGLLGFLTGESSRVDVAREADKLINSRRLVLGQIALLTARRAGQTGDREQMLQADLYKAMEDYKREIKVMTPLLRKVDAQGRLETGLSAGNLHFRVGRAQFHSGQTTIASLEYKQSAGVGKDDPELHFHVGRNLELMGRYREAMDAFVRTASFKSVAIHVGRARSKLKEPRYTAMLEEMGFSPEVLPPVMPLPAPSPRPSVR